MTSHSTSWQSNGGDDGKATSAATPVQSVRLSQIARIAWRGKWLVLLGAAIGTGMGLLYYDQSPPVYRSEAQLLVAKALPNNVGSFSRQISYLMDDIPIHADLITSPLFVDSAVEKAQLGSLPSLAGSEDPTETIIRSLSVTAGNDKKRQGPSSILNFAYHGRSPEDCRIILAAVIANYEEFLEKSKRNANEDALKLLTDKAESLHEEIRGKEVQFQELRRKMPLVGDGRDGPSGWQRRLADIESKKMQLSIRRVEAELRLATVKKGLQDGEDQTALVAMAPEEFLAGQNETLRETIYPLLLQENKLLQTYGDRHPEVRSIREQIQFTLQSFALTKDEAARAIAFVSDPRGAASKELVEAYIRSLEQDLWDIAISEESLDKLLGQEQAHAASQADHEFQQTQLRDDIARSEIFYESLIRQMQEGDLNKDLPGYNMRTISPPETGERVAPNGWFIFPLALLVGIQAGFVLAYWSDTASTRAHGSVRLGVRPERPIGASQPASSFPDELLPQGAIDES